MFTYSFFTFTPTGSSLLLLAMFSLFSIYGLCSVNKKEALTRSSFKNIYAMILMEIILFILVLRVLYNLYQFEVSIMYILALLANLLGALLSYRFYNVSAESKRKIYHILFLFVTILMLSLLVYGIISIF